MPSHPPALRVLALFAQSGSRSGISQDTATHLLQDLYVVAAVLGVALLVVVVIAVIAWRKNKDTDLKP